MSQPYDVPGATHHDPNEWEWIDLGQNGGYWVKRGTNDKGYNCTEYAMAKLFGDPAEWDVDESGTTETDEIEQELRNRGFTEPVSADRCGCGDGKISSCAVLYFDNTGGQRGSEPFHVEVFDRRHCDWGGKGGPGLPIRHRQNPGEFPTDPESRRHTEMVFLCKDGTPGAYVSDAEIHEPPAPAPSDRPPSPPPYSPPWLLRVWNFVFGVLGFIAGWVLHALIAGR